MKLIGTVATVALMFFSRPFLQPISAEPVRVVWLKQLHRNPLKIVEYDPKVSESQFNMVDVIWLQNFTPQLMSRIMAGDPLQVLKEFSREATELEAMKVRREEEALKGIDQFISSSEFHGEPVVLIYGEGHEFKMAEKYHAHFFLDSVLSCESLLRGST